MNYAHAHKFSLIIRRFIKNSAYLCNVLMGQNALKIYF